MKRIGSLLLIITMLFALPFVPARAEAFLDEPLLMEDFWGLPWGASVEETMEAWGEPMESLGVEDEILRYTGVYFFYAPAEVFLYFAEEGGLYGAHILVPAEGEEGMEANVAELLLEGRYGAAETEEKPVWQAENIWATCEMMEDGCLCLTFLEAAGAGTESAAMMEKPEIATETESEEADGKIVYIGKTGTKYHYESCHTLRGKGRAITMEEALSQGREACKVCH